MWHLGPLPVRAYALGIIAGILVAVYLTNKRLMARGAGPDDVWDVAKWAVPFGILGGRVYHVITDPELYFSSGAHPIDAVKIWDGGLGIPGAIAMGALGAWIGCRGTGLRLASFADAAAPGIVIAQAIGRWGNWFNNELYGRATSLPWKLQIHCWNIPQGKAVPCDGTNSTQLGYFQPTFLYESLWNLALAVLLIHVGRRFALGNGRVFALYIMGYSLGRLWVEALRIDPANHILGLRLNIWTALLGFAGGLVWWLRHRGPRENSIYRDGRLAFDTPAQQRIVLDEAKVAPPASAEPAPDEPAPDGGPAPDGPLGKPAPGEPAPAERQSEQDAATVARSVE